jgi:catechol 2,3-dioxygenase-like lactoylglutathione lyase family enzyme
MPDLSTGITHDIYPMPAFVTFAVADIDRTVGFYVGALDWIELFRLPGPDGSPALVHLRRWRYQDILVRPGVADPGHGWAVSIAAAAEDLPDLVARARAYGAADVSDPTDTPWNTRDVTITDPDGYRLVYTARRPEGERDEAFGQRILELGREQRPQGSLPEEPDSVLGGR